MHRGVRSLVLVACCCCRHVAGEAFIKFQQYEDSACGTPYNYATYFRLNRCTTVASGEKKYGSVMVDSSKMTAYLGPDCTGTRVGDPLRSGTSDCIHGSANAGISPLPSGTVVKIWGNRNMDCAGPNFYYEVYETGRCTRIGAAVSLRHQASTSGQQGSVIVYPDSASCQNVGGIVSYTVGTCTDFSVWEKNATLGKVPYPSMQMYLQTGPIPLVSATSHRATDPLIGAITWAAAVLACAAASLL